MMQPPIATAEAMASHCYTTPATASQALHCSPSHTYENTPARHTLSLTQPPTASAEATAYSHRHTCIASAIVSQALLCSLQPHTREHSDRHTHTHTHTHTHSDTATHCQRRSHSLSLPHSHSPSHCLAGNAMLSPATRTVTHRSTHTHTLSLFDTATHCQCRSHSNQYSHTHCHSHPTTNTKTQTATQTLPQKNSHTSPRPHTKCRATHWHSQTH
jgi:hypothetical protein